MTEFLALPEGIGKESSDDAATYEGELGEEVGSEFESCVHGSSRGGVGRAFLIKGRQV